mmetsp:Transcript_64062/g.169726  ORF Transcript_64062/g.169726 Transcript_64062/m.169726 type:complete len:1379 (-) Transcript_64062:88-4224(-)|eukprot:CAMPEP_0194525916 /NCGR_PEP_ID=MMETSP0253-20130528/61568_1 /TAXON_ID=2966 /ORGANISM="Noctiluca scintillans" /LENGTH=1378 /DNA_ID=CAMNT_0039370693 /DNA_START=66 /DNA_END=4202 /DNA_ORIENTATION=+
MDGPLLHDSTEVQNRTPAQHLLWEQWEGTGRGVDSPELWRAYNRWNLHYWKCLTVGLLVVHLILLEVARWNTTPTDALNVLQIGIHILVAVVVFIMLWALPGHAHTVMAAQVCAMFIVNWLVFLIVENSNSKDSFAEPPLFVVVLAFTFRLRPVVPVVLTCICSLCFLVAASIMNFNHWRYHDQIQKESGDLVMHWWPVFICTLFCVVACIFGAQVGAAVFRRQKDIFENLRDYLVVRKCADGNLSYEFAGVGSDTRAFFHTYVRGFWVTRFAEGDHAEEEAFKNWRRVNSKLWLEQREHYVFAGTAAMAIPYFVFSFFSIYFSSPAGWTVSMQGIIQMVCTAVVCLCAVALKLLPKQRVSFALVTVVVAQLVFAVAANRDSLVGGGTWQLLEVLPCDPFIFMLFSAHALWNRGVWPILLFDLVVVSIFVVQQGATQGRTLWIDALPLDLCAYVVLAAWFCLSLTLTLEKYDRILWKLQGFCRDAARDEEQSLGSAGMRSVPEGESMLERGEVQVTVTGFAAQYSDEVFYFVECAVPGQATPHVVLRSVACLRESFLELLHGDSVSAVPFFDESFDGVADASDAAIWHVARRLENILRRHVTPSVAQHLFGTPGRHESVPRLNILLLAVGAQGEVSPFISIARSLIQQGHRCRVAAHSDFERLCLAAGVEFFPLSTRRGEHWQPHQLAEHMEQNPGLLPDRLLRPQDLMKMVVRSPEMSYTVQQILLPTQPGEYQIGEPVIGPWAAAVMPDPRTSRPFVAQALIASPLAFSHVHIAERLGVPCHLAFMMPWTPTASVGHPLGRANPVTAGTGTSSSAYWQSLSYRWVEDLRWGEGRLGSYMNSFRREIGLAAIGSVQNAPSTVDEIKVPFLYMYSPSLLRKPSDWGPHIDICGFDSDSSTPMGTRPAALRAFLESGPPPIYVGFGSISSDIYEIAALVVSLAVELGCRVVVQSGWGPLGDLWSTLPPGVFYVGRDGEEDDIGPLLVKGSGAIGALDHEWLFPQCCALVHHGGCGTTQRGLRHGRPTLIVAFFGDQPLWGGLVQHRGAGRLVLARQGARASYREGLKYVLSDEAVSAAANLKHVLASEHWSGAGAPRAADAFHRQLPVKLLTCDVCRHVAARAQSSPPFVRVARFFDGDTTLRLCDVCCYAVFLQRSHASGSDHVVNVQDTSAPFALGHLRPGRLAVFRSVDWSRGRRRWLRGLGVPAISAMEGGSCSFVGLRGGGLAGAAVANASGLLELLAAPATGARHIANQHTRTSDLDSVASSGACGAEGTSLAKVQLPIEESRRLQICRIGDVGLDFALQVRNFGGLSDEEERDMCMDLRSAFKETCGFQRQAQEVQACGHLGFARALVSPEAWSQGASQQCVLPPDSVEGLA